MVSKFTALGISLILITFVASVSAQSATRPGQIRREAVKERVETKRENIQERFENLRERIASKEAALNIRLAKFKDKKKVEIVERISKNLNKINSNWVEHANRFLANATRILDKLRGRVDSQVSKGKDATSANSAISDAKAKIASASAAVASQSAKDYTVTISSESAARAEIKTIRDSLHSDWQGVRRLLTDAKQAVANAIRVAATTLGGSN